MIIETIFDRKVLLKVGPEDIVDGVLIIPAGIQEIYPHAIARQKGLQKIYFPATVEDIRHGACEKCKDLISVEFAPDSKLTSIGHYAFYQSGLTGLSLPENTFLTLGERCCSGCVNLKSVKIGKKAKSVEIGKCAFEGCGILDDFDFENVSRIGTEAFTGTAFTELRIPQKMRGIGASAFADCKLLERVFTSDSFTFGLTVEEDAFINCESLYRAELPFNTFAVLKGAFKGTKVQNVVVSEKTRTQNSAGVNFVKVSSAEEYCNKIAELNGAGKFLNTEKALI